MISLVRLSVFSFISFLICFLLFPVLIKLLKQMKWFDAPGTHKIHSEYVPSMGGITIFVGTMFALLMGFRLQQWVEMKYFFISVMLMFLIGLRDDVLALSPRQKLFSQFLPVFVLVMLGDVRLTSLYGLAEAGTFSTPLTYFISLFTVIIITNAYNLIDGIDGLAGTVGLIALSFFGIWFYLAGEHYLSLIALCFAGALLAFLIFNWEPSSIFMGDTGALTMGLVLSYFAIGFINKNFQLPQDHQAKFHSSVSTAICVLVIPVFDTLRVIIFRLRRGQSPFHADRNHLHHQFLALGRSHATAVKWMAGINVSFIAIAVLLRTQRDAVILPIVVLICLAINFVIKWRQKSLPSTADA